jgi:8-amino-7-oxononanoate synthase
VDPLAWIDIELARLREAQLLRERQTTVRLPGPRVQIDGRSYLNLSSNDYLGLAASPPAVYEATGSGASRLVVGDLEAHRALEAALAEWLGFEGALVFSSGYAGNVGALAALTGSDSLVVSDALNHASIIDGCRLGRARVVVVPHRDVDAVSRALARASERRRWVVTDAYFSMEGDLAPLGELRAVCDRHDAALYVDEAHALGVWGPEGRGASAAVGARPDVLLGTLGKAFGAGGAFIAGSRPLIQWMWNRARSFVFSTGLSPVLAQSALGALPIVRAGRRTERLHVLASAFRAALERHGCRTDPSTGPIIPIVLGSPERAVQSSDTLRARGILAQPIRPPTVPRETSRLRLAVQAGHDERELVEAATVIAEVVG